MLAAPASPSPLPSKRVPYIAIGSPTEKATTHATPSPRRSFVADDEETHIEPKVEHAMRKMMEEMLTETLSRLVEKSRSRSPSVSPSFSKPTAPTTTPALKSIHALHALLSAQAAKDLEAKLATICDDVLSEAQCLRHSADEEFLMAAEEQRIDMLDVKETTLMDLQKDIDGIVLEKLQELDPIVADLLGDAFKKWAESSSHRARKTISHDALTEAEHGKAEKRHSKRRGRVAGDWKRRRWRGYAMD